MSGRTWMRNAVGVVAVAGLLGAAAVGSYRAASGADHTDGPLATGDQAADIADVYSFQRGDQLVLALTVSNVQAAPEIALGRSIFDPGVLYQFKLDDDGDAVEDLVIQAFATGNPGNQVMHVIGPVAPEVTGTSARIVNGAGSMSVRVSTGASPIVAERKGMKIFAGVRDDPFFFDLARFLAILQGQAGGFNDPGNDTFAGLNVYAIVVELPLTMIGDSGSVRVWGTTSRL